MYPNVMYACTIKKCFCILSNGIGRCLSLKMLPKLKIHMSCYFTGNLIFICNETFVNFKQLYNYYRLVC